ncbi:MAG: Gamma-glutamyltransferase [Verrucomicrobiales bacterium]|nr:Gamma-glutamyltransferase [Verrucomicrobiales bacterium]
MKRITRRQMLIATAQASAAAMIAPACATRRMSEPQRGILLGDVEGTKAAKRIFAAGGNAIDAAIAAAFVAGISSPSKCGIGGYGGSMMIAQGDAIYCIDFNSVAPAAARPDMFPLDANGAVVGKVNFHGWLAAGVPGVPAGLELALRKFGTKTLREVLQPAIELAATRPENPRFSYAALRRTLTTFAERNSVDSFYRGDIAHEIAEAFAKHGGLVTTKDLANYKARLVTPYKLQWDDATIYTAPLSSGGLTTLEALNIFKATPYATQPASVERTHAQVEALRLAWRDRAQFLGDPDFVEVPVEQLLSNDYAKELAAEVDAAVQARKAMAIDVPRIQQTGTCNLSATDHAGNFVAMTLTMGNGYGAQVTVESVGMVLGHGMSRFEPEPGRANSVAPGKRPLHNMCPSLMTRNGKPTIAIGAAGGTKIPNALYEFFSNHLGEGQSFPASIDAPRLNTTGSLELRVEKLFPPDHRAYLQQIGFKVLPGVGPFVSAVRRDPRTGVFDGRDHIGDPFEMKQQLGNSATEPDTVR